MSLSEWIPILSAVVGGGGVSAAAALFTYRLNKRKTIVEIEKLNLDITKLKSEFDYKLSNMQEHILFDSRQGMDGFDFQARGTAIEKGQAVAEGKHRLLDGKVLSIERTNREGRYEVILMQLDYQNMKRPYVPANLAIAGRRKIMVRYLAKAIGGKHQVKTVLKNTDKEGKWLAHKDDDIESRDQWEEIECFFLVDPAVEFLIRFDDQGVSILPSSIQIRDIIVTEKAS
jgi:hypothetical protein